MGRKHTYTIHHRVSHDFIGSRNCRTEGVHCRESVVSKHNHCCTAAVHTVNPFFSPDLCLYKRRKFSVHGTVSYVVFQNIPRYDVLLLYILWAGFYPLPTYAFQRVKNLCTRYNIICLVFQNIVITTVL